MEPTAGLQDLDSVVERVKREGMEAEAEGMAEMPGEELDFYQVGREEGAEDSVEVRRGEAFQEAMAMD